MSLVKIVLVVIAIVIYISLSHMALLTADPYNMWRQIAVLMLVVPVIGMLTWSVYAALRPIKIPAVLKWFCTACIFISAVYVSHLLWLNMLTRLDWFYLAQHAVANLLLGYFFGQTLLQGRTPIITTLARTVHGELPESIVRYTRGVTIAWTIFFVVQVALSFLIFYWFSTETWSLFANVLNWPMVILMFAAEYICRKKMNPDFKHANMKESIAAYFAEKNKA